MGLLDCFVWFASRVILAPSRVDRLPVLVLLGCLEMMEWLR